MKDAEDHGADPDDGTNNDLSTDPDAGLTEIIKMYSCAKCAKQYKGLKSLIGHEKKCKGISILTCPICMKTFSSTSNKSKHCSLKTCKPKYNMNHYYNTYIVQQSGNVCKPIYSFIYILLEREFLDKREPIYKIGKTRQPNFKRFNSYPKGSVLELFTHCKDCDIVETVLINRFKTLFEPMKNIGNEYFKGDLTDMIDVALTNIVKINKGWK